MPRFTAADERVRRLFPVALRDLRKATGLDQTEAARRAGIRRAMWWNYENGRHYPHLPVLVRVLDAVGSSLSGLEEAMDRLDEERELALRLVAGLLVAGLRPDLLRRLIVRLHP